jgi:hypothetical protein
VVLLATGAGGGFRPVSYVTEEGSPAR